MPGEWHPEPTSRTSILRTALTRPQQKAAQSRKVRPKSMPQSKPPKLEELGVKVEPGTAAPATATGSATPVPSAATAASNATAAAPASLLPKQRLLIKIPRSAVTAATAHAAEVAAAAAAAEAAEASLAVRATATVAATAVKVKEEATDVRVSKRGKGKSGVKRARPLAGTRTSPPPPPPPAPTSRQVGFWLSAVRAGARWWLDRSSVSMFWRGNVRAGLVLIIEGLYLCD